MHIHDVMKLAINKSYISKHNALKLVNILKYGELTCELCKRPINKKKKKYKFTIDHKIPKSKGGDNSYSNLQIAHAICNNRKSSKIDGQMTLWDLYGEVEV